MKLLPTDRRSDETMIAIEEEKMDVEIYTIWILGAAQLLVFIASLTSERLLTSVVGFGGISDILVNISKNLSRVRINTLVALVNCLVIILLGVMSKSRVAQGGYSGIDRKD